MARHPPNWNNMSPGQKAAWTRKHNSSQSTRSARTSRNSAKSHSKSSKNCPNCGFKLPKSLLKRERRKVSPEQKRRMTKARNAAIAAGWTPFTSMSKTQHKAFCDALNK